MPKTYTTRQGDTFESIAWFALGNSNLMTDLIRENPGYMYTAVFEAGVTLALPDQETIEATSESGTNPPWR